MHDHMSQAMSTALSPEHESSCTPSGWGRHGGAACGMLSTCDVQQLSPTAHFMYTYRENYAGHILAKPASLGECMFLSEFESPASSTALSVEQGKSQPGTRHCAACSISPRPCRRYGATCGRHARRSWSRPSRASNGCLTAALRSACDPVLPGWPQPQRALWVVMAASFARPGACDTLEGQQAPECFCASSEAHGCSPTIGLKLLSATHLLHPPQLHPSVMALPQACLV